MKQKNYEKGITLISLVITIIILLILAGVTTYILINRGIMEKSETAVDEYKISEYKDKIEVIKLGENVKKVTEHLEPSLKDLVTKKLKDEENGSWVKKVETSIEDEGLEDNQIKVLTQEDYIIVAEINENGTVTYIKIEKENWEPYPKVEVEVLPLEGTENEKVKIQVKAEVEKIKKTKKIAKIELIKDGITLETRDYDESKVEDIFEVEENGTYRIKAITDQEKSTTKKAIVNIEGTENIIEITSEPTTSRNTESIGTKNGVATGPITVTIEYGETELQKQYKIGSGDWQTVSGTSTQIEITENIAIIAKYFDGRNSFKATTYNIQNVDNIVPNAFNITTTNTTNSITVSASTEDTASAGAASGIEGIVRYEYRINNGEWQTSNEFKNLTTGTYTVQAKAIDKAGNERISTNTETVPLETVSTADIKITATPTTSRNTESTGTKNGVATGPITVTITYGNSGYTRQYKVGSGDWQTVSGTSTNVTVTTNTSIIARYYDGTNGFQTSSYNIQNVDNVAPNTFNITTTNTTNSITVTASTTDTASTGAASGIAGILRYEYRINNGSWQENNEFTKLTTGTYTVQAKAIDKAGNERICTNTETVTLGTVSTADITINATPTTSRNTESTGTKNGVSTGPITVTITYGNSGYTRQYKVGSGSWQTVSGTSTNVTVTENTSIIARYYDGTNGFQTSAYNIQNVDNVPPTFTNYNATVSGAIITASANATDTASTGAASGIAGVKSYQYSINGTNYQTANTFTISAGGNYTIYIKAIDKAGNERIVTKTVTVNQYTITFNANGGSVSQANKTVIQNTQYGNLPTPTRTGYSFTGWYTAASGGTNITNNSTASISSNQTLYAHWTANTYTITFNANGGSVSPTSKTVTHNTQYGSLPTPSRTGYSFAGWYTAASGGTNIINTTTANITSNQTLYAHWTINTYTITYNANGGTGEPGNQTKTYGVNLTLSTSIPQRQGYSFLGWSTNSAATTATYSAGATYTENANTTLYAIWIKNETPVIRSTRVSARNTDYITIYAYATDADRDTLTYKLYLRTENGSYSSTPNATASGTAVNLQATGLSTYTVYKYKVEVTDGKTTITSSEGTTGTGCSRKTYSCNKLQFHGVCRANWFNSNGICSNCHSSETSWHYICENCEFQSGAMGSFCSNTSCSNYGTLENAKKNTFGSHYICTEHNYSTWSNYDIHTHYYCEHGYSKLHFPN